MKFTDGYWQTLPGVSILRPRAVDEVVTGERGLTAYAGTGRLETRGDTLNSPLVTISLDSPAEGVIGVAWTRARRSSWPTRVRTSRCRARPTRTRGRP
jgi:hypothetical protein